LKRIDELLESRRFSEAESLATAALPGAMRDFGTISTQVADLLDAQCFGRLRRGLWSEDETKRVALEALRIREAAAPGDDSTYTRALSSLCFLIGALSDYESARGFCERRLAIAEKNGASNLLRLGLALQSMGSNRMYAGDPFAAIGYLERAATVISSATRPEPRARAGVLHDLGNAYKDAGDYDRARPLSERALAMYDSLGLEDYVANALNSLANILTDTGDLVRSRELLERSLVLKAKRGGKDSPDYALGLNNLASRISDLGNFAEARTLYERALAIYEKTLGEHHRYTAMTLANIGNQYAFERRFLEARPYFERAVAAYDSVFGSGNQASAGIFSAMADVALGLGDTVECARLNAVSLENLRATLGDSHPSVAYATRYLATALHRLGRADSASARYRSAIARMDSTLGPLHPASAEAREAYGALLWEEGEHARAMDEVLRAADCNREHLLGSIRVLEEGRAVRYAANRSGALERALGFVEAGADSLQAGRVIQEVVRTRAMILDEMSARRRLVSLAPDSATRALARMYERARRRVANLYVAGAGSVADTGLARALVDASKERAAIELVLARHSAEFRQQQDFRRVGIGDIRHQLPDGAVLVSYVRFEDAPFRQASPETRGARYLAFVLSKDRLTPRVISLGGAEGIDSLASAWRLALGARAPSRASQAHCRSLGVALRERVWDPIKRYIPEADMCFVVGDGALQLLNYAAFPIGETEFLLDRGPVFHLLSAERDLLRATADSEPGRGLLAVGGVDYQVADVEQSVDGDPANMAHIPESSKQSFRGALSSCVDFRSMRFEPLRYSAQEVREIGTLWLALPRVGGLGGSRSDIVVLTDSAATESSFKHLAPGRRVVHIASHGYFLGDGCRSATTTDSGVSSPTHEAPRDVAGETPLVLSGVALAGANRRDSVMFDREDGVLTAEEIATMDLSGAEWVVLSACETGVGSIVPNEGVFGLRRAVHIAGARTLLMSLWSVGDSDARSWMREAYVSHFERGLPTAEAAREASRKMLREARRKRWSTHPGRWAAFVATGAWR